MVRQDKVVRLEDSEKLIKVKKQLKEKLDEKEISDLCQTQRELTHLQMELENQKEQFQAQILFQGKN